MAYVGDRWDDSPAGSEELFDFGVAEFSEVVEDLVVVLVLHGFLLLGSSAFFCPFIGRFLRIYLFFPCAEVDTSLSTKNSGCNSPNPALDRGALASWL